MTDKFVYHLDPEQKVLAWQVRGDLTPEEMPEILKTIRSSVRRLKPSVKLLIDNRLMLHEGLPLIFVREVNEDWRGVQLEILDDCARSAVLCNGLSMKRQMDVLARSTGLHRIQSQFWDPDPEQMKRQAYAFLGITGNALLDSEETH